MPGLRVHPLGLLTSRLCLLANLPFAFVQPHLALGRLPGQRGGPRHQRLLHLVAVRLGILAGPLQQGGHFPGRGRTDLGSLVLGRAQQLFHPVTKAAVRCLLLLLEQLPSLPQFLFVPVGAPLLTLYPCCISASSVSKARTCSRWVKSDHFW